MKPVLWPGIVLLAGALACAGAGPGAEPATGARDATKGPILTPQRSGATNRLQAISPVSPQVAWASGTGGTYAVTIDGGATWRTGVVPGADTLEFRDVEGINAREAYRPGWAISLASTRPPTAEPPGPGCSPTRSPRPSTTASRSGVPGGASP